jgi:hypothetical protein
VSDPANIQRLGGFENSYIATTVQVVENLAFLTETFLDWARERYLSVNDVSDPANISSLLQVRHWGRGRDGSR